MSRLVLIRHGQASFFADDYDKLSEMGEHQARALAEHWRRAGQGFDEVYTGTLERQRRTAEVVGEVFTESGQPWPRVEILPGLDEYPADDIMEHLLPELAEQNAQLRQLERAFEQAESGVDKYRSFHRLLAAVMDEWIEGKYVGNGVMPWEQFRDSVRDAIRAIMSKEGSGRHVAVFSSGGVIGVAVQSVMQAPDRMAAELNWRIHNCSLTEFTFSGPRVSLDCFNAVPHLIHDPELLTYR